MKVNIDDIHFSPEVAELIDKTFVKDIAESIKKLGLIHPVLVQPLNAEGGKKFILRVGLKRLLAHIMLGEASIEVNTIDSSVDADTAEEMSIDENLRRANLEWWQAAKLIEAMHALYQKRHDTRKNKTQRDYTGKEKVWGIRDTAEALGRSMGGVSEDIKLAKLVELNPALKNVKDRRTAVKLARAEARRYQAEDDAGADDLFASSEVPRDDLLFGDSISVLKMVPDLSFDACVTDPPWLRFQGQAKLEKDEATDKVFHEVFRVLRVNTFLYAFVGFEDWYYYKQFLPKIGFTVSKTPLIWRKVGAMSPVGVSAWEYSRDFELILLAVKGTPSLTKRITKSGVFEYKIVPPRNMIHPHEKPVPLIQDIIQDCTYEGASIIEPFAGSGAVLEAARNLKRSWLGVERDRESYLKARGRLGLKEE
jgi:adenine-specific DNA-methyltransferase